MKNARHYQNQISTNITEFFPSKHTTRNTEKSQKMRLIVKHLKRKRTWEIMWIHPNKAENCVKSALLNLI